jgi:hypothetical protein
VYVYLVQECAYYCTKNLNFYKSEEVVASFFENREMKRPEVPVCLSSLIALFVDDLNDLTLMFMLLLAVGLLEMYLHISQDSSSRNVSSR